MNIAIAGMGYVGLALGTMLAHDHHVSLVDVLPEKVQMLNDGKSPIRDTLIQQHLDAGVDLVATLDGPTAYAVADLVIVSVPTDYDPYRGWFDTSNVDQVVELVRSVNNDVPIVVKSTIPMGYTDALAERTPGGPVLFRPEFLREGRALYDSLHPTRIVAGIPQAKRQDPAVCAAAETLVGLLVAGAEDEDVPVLVMSALEAEMVKLFSNTFLAARVAFFNELDNFAASRNLDAASVVRAVSLDPIIGDWYNNPSFGYGGYCLPKDSKQLLANMADVPHEIVQAVVSANDSRKAFVAQDILRRLEAEGQPKDAVVGIYLLAMKLGSDNSRASAIQGVVGHLAQAGVSMVLFDPNVTGEEWQGIPVVRSLDEFKAKSCLIVANRMAAELDDVAERVYTRDVFGRDYG